MGNSDNEDKEDKDIKNIIFPGQEETRDEVRRKAIGRIIKRPRKAPERRPAPPEDVRAIREGVEEIVDNTELLQIIASRLLDIQDTVIATTEILDPHFDEDYIYVNQTVWPRKSFDINILERIGHSEPHGWIKKDTPEGTLNVQINGQEDVELFGADELEPESLLLKDVEFSVPSDSGTQSFRAMFW